MTYEQAGASNGKPAPSKDEQWVRDFIDKMAAASVPTSSTRDEPATQTTAPEKKRAEDPGERPGWWARFLKRKNRHYSVDEHSLEDYSSKLARLRFEDHQFDAKLKKYLGTTVICLLILQVILMNAGFGYYGYVEVVSRGRALHETVVIAWITSSIVQVVGLATVVAKYLFPGEGNNWAHEPN